MKQIVRFLPIIVYFSIIFYAFRGIYLQPFDEPYWKDRYEQSQWNLPLSTRTIGDDGLYLYEGWKLIHGANPAGSNAEMPPLGKYLIGLCTILFQNGNISGYISTGCVIIMFYLLTRTIFPKHIIAWGITTLFALDPLVVSQFPLTMLDSVQTLFLLGFFLLLTKTVRAANHTKILLYCLALGISVGLFSSSKPPILSLVLILLGTGIIARNHTRLRSVSFTLISTAVFLLSSLATYIATYMQYFLLGHSLTEWMRVQKWIVSFYIQGHIVPKYSSLFSTMLFNQYHSIFSNTISTITEWSPLWPFLLIGGCVGYISVMRKNISTSDIAMFVMGFFTCFLLILFSVIPFWPRYLLLLLPFLYTGVGILLQNIKRIRSLLFIITVCVTVQLFRTTTLILPTPDIALRQFIYDWEHGFFHDMYEQIATTSKRDVDRKVFHRLGQTFIRDGQIENIKISVAKQYLSRLKTAQSIPVTVTYFTRHLGSFTEQKTVPIVKEQNRWRIAWNWDLFLSGLSEKSKLHTIVRQYKRGSVIGSDSKLISYDFPSYAISVIPGDIDKTREEEFLQFLERIFAPWVKAIEFHHRYVFNTQADWPILLGTFPIVFDETDMSYLRQFPGIHLTPSAGRHTGHIDTHTVGAISNTHYFECCSLLYSTTTYDGVSGIEQDNNEILKGFDGGSLVIENQEGDIIRSIISVEGYNGSDVRL